MDKYRQALRKLITGSVTRDIRRVGKAYKKEDGSWDYQINKDFEKVIFYMLDNDLTSIVDLGAGMGHCLEIARRCGFQVKGYEVDEFLTHQHKLEVPVVFVERRDIMTLSHEDIRKYELVYAWAPYHDKVKELLFLEHVLGILGDHQKFMYFDQDRNIKIYTNEKSLQL